MKKLILLLSLSVVLTAKTQTIIFSAGCFWGVEKYFDYLEKHPFGYCPNHATGIKFNKKKIAKEQLKKEETK